MTARIRVESGGRLLAEPEAVTELETRPGTFALLTTCPDLIAAVRLPAEGGRVRKPRVVLLGDASAFPVSDLIAFLSQSRWTGILRVNVPGGERALVLADGEVRGASSEDPADRLSEVLVRLGHASRAHVEEALRQHPPSRVGRALVERGLLQPHDLWNCVSHQVSEIFHAIVQAREGAFLLLDQDLEDWAGPSLQLSTQSLLMDAIRKIDELQHFRQRIPHGHVYVFQRRPSDGKLEPDEDRVLGLIDGRRTVLELAQAAKLSEFDATKILFRLLEGGYALVSELKPVPVVPLARTPTKEKAAEPATRVVRTFNAVFAEVLGEVAVRGQGPAFVAAANAALESRSLSDSPVLKGLLLGVKGTFSERELLEAFARHRSKLGSQPVASLRQALSDVMFFLLFQAGEILDSRTEEELARRVKGLLATLE